MIMKRVFLLLLISLCSCLLAPYCAMADETVTVSATNADISENLDLKTVATLFGQAKDLEQFEQMLKMMKQFSDMGKTRQGKKMLGRMKMPF